jgi:hypothetical protein
MGGENKYWFLLQNSWKQMPLLEVSGEYLMKNLKPNLGSLVYIEGDLSQAPNTVEMCEALVSESSFYDGGDEG